MKGKPSARGCKLLVEPLEGRVVPATITVTSLADGGAGTLRAAITQANLDSTPDTIDFAPALTGSIKLLTTLPVLNSSISINGPGASKLSIVGPETHGDQSFYFFVTASDRTCSVSGLTLKGAWVAPEASGGAVINYGKMTVTSCDFLDNRGGKNASGAAIYNRFNMTVVHCSFVDNNIDTFGYGAAIENGSDMTVLNSSFEGNDAGLHGYGGAIDNYVRLTVVASSFSGNSARFGGAVYNDGQAVVDNSTFSGNGSPSFGDGGALLNSDELTITNSTIVGNRALGRTGETNGVGGGVWNQLNARTELIDSTVANNMADGGGGGVFNSGIVVSTATIFDKNSGGNLSQWPSYASFQSGGHNLFSDTPAVTLSSTDLTDTDPLLAPLANNGGPTRTMALLPGSPAIGAGVAVSGVTSDQRGVSRPQGGQEDIGAFESRGFSINVVHGSGQSAVINQPFATPLTVTVTSPYGEPVAGGQVTFAAPTSGASASLSGETVTIGADGTAAVDATANGVTGAYVVTANSNGSTAASFKLTNTLPPPKVLGVLRYGYHLMPTVLTVGFNAPLDPTTATLTSNYIITGPGGGWIPVSRATYDAAHHTVTLIPSRRLDLHYAYTFVIVGVGPHPVRGVGGVPLDGAGNGKPGSNYVTTLTAANLVVTPGPGAGEALKLWLRARTGLPTQ